MKKIDTTGLPAKVNPHTLKGFPEAITAKALIDALQQTPPPPPPKS